MTKSGFLLIAAALAGLAIPAEAGTRLHFGFRPFYPGYQSYYAGPRYIPAPRYSYYYDPGARFDYGYEPDYYEPDYDAPRVYRPPPKTKKATKPAVTKKAKPAPTLISCSQASKIVAGYGFSAIKSTDCKGQVYAFKAVRDGKNFTIKLSAKNGELTEVKKL